MLAQAHTKMPLNTGLYSVKEDVVDRAFNTTFDENAYTKNYDKTVNNRSARSNVTSEDRLREEMQV